jgi:hypothetical protein
MVQIPSLVVASWSSGVVVEGWSSRPQGLEPHRIQKLRKGWNTQAFCYESFQHPSSQQDLERSEIHDQSLQYLFGECKPAQYQQVPFRILKRDSLANFLKSADVPFRIRRRVSLAKLLKSAYVPQR